MSNKRKFKYGDRVLDLIYLKETYIEQGEEKRRYSDEECEGRIAARIKKGYIVSFGGGLTRRRQAHELQRIPNEEVLNINELAYSQQHNLTEGTGGMEDGHDDNGGGGGKFLMRS